MPRSRSLSSVTSVLVFAGSHTSHVQSFVRPSIASAATPVAFTEAQKASSSRRPRSLCCFRAPTSSRRAVDRSFLMGTGGDEAAEAREKEGLGVSIKPAWVEDPDEDRVKAWIRAAGRKGDFNRVAMYLRKYREGRASKGEVPGVEVYNTALRALDECQKWKLALSVFREMQADGVTADRNSYFFAISACSRCGEARTAQHLLAEMQAAQVNGGPAPDLLLYAVAIKACAVGKTWRKATELLENMSSMGVKPNVVVVNTVLTACAKCGEITKAKELLRTMEKVHGVSPDALSFNAVISGHERLGEWREALDVARQMERLAGVAPTVVTFNSIIGACKRAGRPREALAVLGLLRRKGLKPDVISFNSAISACASGGKWEEALQLLEVMPEEGLTPDVTTYNTALDACAKSGQWEIAMSLFEELLRSREPSLMPDLYTYNTVLAIFSSSGMLARALELLEEAKAQGLRPDVVTYSTLIRACERAVPPQPDVAVQLIADMENAGVRPNNTTFVSVALCLGRARKPLESLAVLQHMHETGSPPDAICCQTVLRVLDRWDCAEEAFELFEGMREGGFAFAPEVAEEMYCCGIRALEKLGKWSAAVSLLEEWRSVQDGHPDTESTYDQWYRALQLLAAGGVAKETDIKTVRAAMVSAARGGLAEEASAILRSMEGAGFRLGMMEYGALMEALERGGKPERCLEIFDEMVASGVEPDVLCLAAATRCACRRGDWHSAVRLLETTFSDGLLPAGRTIQMVARLCRKEGKYETLWHLKELMRSMMKAGGSIRPGSSIYVSLIHACGAADRPDLVLRCLAEMKLDRAPGKGWGNLAVDEPFTIAAAVGALSECDEIAEADRIYVDAIRRNILPDPIEDASWAVAAARTKCSLGRPRESAMTHQSSPRASSAWAVDAASRDTSTLTSAVTDAHDGEERVLDGGAQNRSGGDSNVNPVRITARRTGVDRARISGRQSPAADTQASRGNSVANENDRLRVDLRQTPIPVVSAAIRRVVQAMEMSGVSSNGLVVFWGGARGQVHVGDVQSGGSRTADGYATPKGRRESVLEALKSIEPPLELAESSRNRGQVILDKSALNAWLRHARDTGGSRYRQRGG